MIRSALWSSAAYATIVACNIPIPQDGGGGFSGDNDKISTAVEVNPPNKRLYRFDTLINDPNPSQARGMPTGGTLYKGINLPDSQAGYRHHNGVAADSADKDDWGTLALVNRIEGVARQWIDAFQPCIDLVQNPTPPPRFSVGDMSKGIEATQTFGGPWLPDHPASHQNGLDVDLRFARTDNTLEPLRLDGASSAFYDPGATADLMYCFLKFDDVVLLAVDTDLARINFGDFAHKVEHRTDHRDHWHIRIADPDGLANLRREVSGR